MKYLENFDKDFKILLRIFIRTFTKLFYIMDLLKIFRMQEPVPKDLLTRTGETNKHKEPELERETMLCNYKARIRQLESQVMELESKNRNLEAQAKPQCSTNLIKEYETFYLKIMTESKRILQEKQELENKLTELELFCRNLVQKYEKAKIVINQYQEHENKLNKQLMENEVSKNLEAVKTGGGNLIKRQMEMEFCVSLFEPLKGL